MRPKTAGRDPFFLTRTKSGEPATRQMYCRATVYPSMFILYDEFSVRLNDGKTTIDYCSFSFPKLHYWEHEPVIIRE